MVDGARPRFLCSEIRASTLSVAAKLHTMSNKYQNWSGLRTLLITRIDQLLKAIVGIWNKSIIIFLKLEPKLAKLYTIYQNLSDKNYCKINWLTQL